MPVVAGHWTGHSAHVALAVVCDSSSVRLGLRMEPLQKARTESRAAAKLSTFELPTSTNLPVSRSNIYTMATIALTVTPISTISKQQI